MRYGTQTSLSPDDVIERARSFFGEHGELGLPEAAYQSGTVTFGDETGGVNVSATSTNGSTDVTILSREYDTWAEQFIRELH